MADANFPARSECRSMLLSFALLYSLSSVGACSCEGCAPKATPSGSVKRSNAEEAPAESLKVVSYDNRFTPAMIRRLAESQRTHLYWHWQGTEKPPVWEPPCVIVIHATRASYTAAVGRVSEATFGSSLIDNRNCKCRSRRVDLLSDRQGQLSALPHELTHVAISDMLGGRTPPRWLDEGIALLADSTDKQDRHKHDLESAKRNRLTFRAAELLRLGGNYPPPAKIPAFYAQSASLTAFLARRGKPGKLLEFARISLEKGYDEALRDAYQLDGVAALEQEWLADANEDAYSLARASTLP